VFSGPCRFNGSIQRQEVCLAGDFLDYRDLPGNLLHSRNCLSHCLPSFPGTFGGLDRDLFGLERILGILFGSVNMKC
jgi:hypothetical protein